MWLKAELADVKRSYVNDNILKHNLACDTMIESWNSVAEICITLEVKNKMHYVISS